SCFNPDQPTEKSQGNPEQLRSKKSRRKLRKGSETHHSFT
ncbi:33331_t:CDS:1, partial [Racocetra persica]